MKIKKIYKNHKKKIYITLTLLLIIWYFSFFYWKNDWFFSAKDLEVKTIDSKKDFEEIIVKNIYDKIKESCKNHKTKHTYTRNTWEIDSAWEDNWLDFSLNDDSALIWSSESISNDFDIPSISFDWWNIKKETIENISFSETNIQKKEVDEGDILKQTKDYIFYFSKNNSKIYIIKSPINWEEINIANTKAVFEIEIPSNITLNWELFVNDDRLIYLASKNLYNNNNTIVWIYDISNLSEQKVKLVKIFETKWEYFKSRLIDNNLYLISNFSLKWYKTQFCNILENENNSGLWEFINFFTWMNFNFWLNEKIYNELKEELESFSYKIDNFDMTFNWENKQIWDFKIFYTEKDLDESIENLNFSIVSTINIESKDKKDSQVIVFWNLENWEIHMTLDNLYLVNSYYKAAKWKCDYIDICYKEFASNNFTSISKISYDENDLKYQNTSIIPWKPINQYSMDEDEWYFRIFTIDNSSWRNSTSLFVFNEKMKLIWELEKIWQREDFKTARFIWDKAFLVTFKQIDPLFVIDLHIPSTPKVIWELEIPWYSNYLHPYWQVWTKQYLIWLGKENNDTKVDLYEIDYDKKDIWWNIEVNQKYSYKFDWYSSQSPAEENPRAFVWNSEEKLLYLPIYINNQKNNFTWLKVLNIDLENWINETESNAVINTDINNSRVWYYNLNNSKSSFFVSPDFIWFFWENNESNIINFK